MKRAFLIFGALMLAAFGAGCSDNDNTDEVSKESRQTTASVTAETQAEAAREVVEDSAAEVGDSGADESSFADNEISKEHIEALSESSENSQGILSSADDLGLNDISGDGSSFTFTYDGEEYSAIYTEDNWKIIDSYKITRWDDIVIICQALKDIHPIHTCDLTAYREADDMAYEWLQHNIAYTILPDSSQWKANAKDVDINPADQGRNIYEMYKARTGSDLIPGLSFGE